MNVTDTIIKWHVVNMRAENKNLPEENKRIVYYQDGICCNTVSIDEHGKTCIYGYKKQYIKTGFLWCYQSDIPIPKEINTVE